MTVKQRALRITELRKKLKLSEHDLEQISLILAEKLIRKAIDKIGPSMIYFECRQFVEQMLDAIKYADVKPKKRKKRRQGL